MNHPVSIIAVGDEVLYGLIANTNARYIAEALFLRGFRPVTHIVTSDHPAEIASILREQLSQGRDVIVTGGLGPTLDDQTRAVVSDIFKRPLVENGRVYPQPEGAVLLENRSGTAPGLFLEDLHLFPGSRLFLLPGPPAEMADVLLNEVIPRFFPQGQRHACTLRLLGCREADIDGFFREQHQQWPDVHIGLYPSYGFVTVRLWGDNGPAVQAVKAAVQRQCPEYTILEEAVSLEEAFCRLLRRNRWTFATAESCTGGALAARMTAIPGVSDIFLGGVVAYHTKVKEGLLRVPPDLLAQHGPVSMEVTRAMARSAQAIVGADVVCSVSGYFGPSGGTSLAPSGTVWTTMLFPGLEQSEKFFFTGTRGAICEKTVQSILARLVLIATRLGAGLPDRA